jgi:hypothetical protein
MDMTYDRPVLVRYHAFVSQAPEIVSQVLELVGQAPEKTNQMSFPSHRYG